MQRSNISPKNGKFIFPVADGRIKFLGGDQELRTSTLIRDQPIRGEGQRHFFLGESEGSPPQDPYPDAGEARERQPVNDSTHGSNDSHTKASEKDHNGKVNHSKMLGSP